MSAISLRLLTGVDRQDSGKRQQPAEYAKRETVLLLVAAVTLIGALIHVGAGVDHFHEFPLYTVVFCLLAVAQMTWAAMLLRRPSRRVLILGCAMQAAIVGLWALSRTVGVPIAPRAWVPEQIGAADLVETVGECMTVIAVLSIVLASRSALVRAASERMAPVLLLVLLAGVLFGTGAHAG
jgi:hypothetical protein